MKLTKLPLVAALSLLVLSSNAWAQSTKRLIDEVNPFIGTSNFGTTNPGAVVPNGLMSITPFNVSGSPELNKFDKDKRWWSTPYTADNKFFSGFSHVNLSGVGCPELGEYHRIGFCWRSRCRLYALRLSHERRKGTSWLLQRTAQ